MSIKYFPPEKGGVYFLYGKDENLIYIGKSNNIRCRIQQHMISYPYSPRKEVLRIHYFSCIIIEDEHERGEAEKILIKKHNPPFNRLYTKVQQMNIFDFDRDPMKDDKELEGDIEKAWEPFV